MTSSNGTFSALLALCAGNSPVTGKFPAQRPVTRSLDVFFDLRLIKNSWVNNCEAGDLRRGRAHYDVIVMIYARARKSNYTPHFDEDVITCPVLISMPVD